MRRTFIENLIELHKKEEHTIWYIPLIFILLFSACSVREYQEVTPKILLLKSKKLRFSDLAYLRHSDDAIELELFVAGRVVKRITINHLVCIDEGCMRKSSFNSEYFCAAYPETLFQNILLGKKIYGGENLLYLNGGFEQLIEKDGVDIEYRVDAKGIYFRDRKNAILFKIKDTHQ